VIVTTHFHLVPRLRRCGAIPPFTFYNFITFIGGTSSIPFKISGQVLCVSLIRVCNNRDFRHVSVS